MVKHPCGDLQLTLRPCVGGRRQGHRKCQRSLKIHALRRTAAAGQDHRFPLHRDGREKTLDALGVPQVAEQSSEEFKSPSMTAIN